MTDFDPWPLPDGTPATSFRDVATELAVIVERHGPDLFFDPDLLARHLEDAAPASPVEIALVMTGLAHDIPQRVLSAHGDDALRALQPRLVDHLITRAALDRARAAWVVETWALAVRREAVQEVPAPSPAAASATIETPFETDLDPFAGTDVPVGPHAGFAPDTPVLPLVVEPLTKPTVDSDTVDALIDAVRARLDTIEPRPMRPQPRPFWRIGVPIAAISLVAFAYLAMRMDANDPAVAVTSAASTVATTPSPTLRPAIGSTAIDPVASPAVDGSTAPSASAADSVSAQFPAVAPAADAPVGSTSPATNDATARIEKPIPNSATIARIDPPRVTRGRPFGVTMHVAGDAADVASVEARTVEAAGVASDTATRLPVDDLRRNPGGEWLVPLPAGASTAPALELTLVDRDGNRSASERVALLSTRTPDARGDAALRGVSQGTCTRATCGVVTDVRELDGGGAFMTTIRTDDGKTYAVVEGTRYPTGVQIQKRGDRFIPLTADR